MKEIVSYKNGEFVDYLGETHKFVVCAVSTKSLEDSEGNEVFNVLRMETYDDYVDEIDFPRALFLGVSICNPKDEFDLEKGKIIAYNKATTVKNINHPAIYTTRPGFINTEVVEALLNNSVEYIKRDPGSVIPGYDEARKKYLKKKENEEFLASVNPEILDLAKSIKSLDGNSKEDLARILDMK